MAWRGDWKLVPIEPTEAMLNQAITVKKHIAQAGPNQHVGKIWAAEIYEAMIGVVDCDCENEPLGLVNNECPEHNINPASPHATVDVGALRGLVEKWRNESNQKYPRGTAAREMAPEERYEIEGRCEQLDTCADELAALIGEKA